MTKTKLLEAMRDMTLDVTRDLLLPVKQQKEDAEPPADRPASVYIARIPDMAQSAKKAPYILHQIVNSKFQQEEGQLIESRTTVRSIFCVYCDDEQEGGLQLINLMERIRIALMKNPLIGDNQFECDYQEGIEDLVYPDDTYPYYMGEMITVWKLPRVKREVPELWR